MNSNTGGSLLPPPRKISTSMKILLGALLGLGVLLLTMNHFHTSRCGTHATSLQLEESLKNINNRLLQAESQALRNAALRESLLKVLQSKIVQVEHQHFQELSMNSQDEAVKVSILLSSAENSANRAPEYDLNDKYRNAEILADAINDILKEVDENSADSSLDLVISKHEVVQLESVDNVSTEEMAKLCSEWKKNYNVITGVSWGDLPYDLQQKWSHYSCDTHLLGSI